MGDEPTSERTVVVHTAGTWTEAVVIRGLLESNGIASPVSEKTDPFPLRQPPKGFHGVEIRVLESQAEQARAVISDYLASPDTISLEESAEEEAEEPTEEPGA